MNEAFAPRDTGSLSHDGKVPVVLDGHIHHVVLSEKQPTENRMASQILHLAIEVEENPERYGSQQKS